jgi:AraC family transcriptional regulator
MTESTPPNTNFKPRAENTCIMDYSSFTELEARGTIKNFAIKYVVSGIENYSVNEVDFKVAAGEYMLAGFSGDVSVRIDSKTEVKGICVDLSKDVLNEVLSYQFTPGANTENQDLWRLMSSSDFPESKYQAFGTHLGNILLKLQPQVIMQGVKYLQPQHEAYYQITEALVADCMPNMRIFRRIKAIKATTRKELFRKLLRSKNFIDNDCPVRTEIGEIAQLHGFSEYHFFRLFKTAFGISPYQYLLNKRLLHASQLLTQSNLNVSDVTFACGYGDIHTFSRAFKKKFGHSPSYHFRS